MRINMFPLVKNNILFVFYIMYIKIFFLEVTILAALLDF